jgi:hypothetical protein
MDSHLPQTTLDKELSFYEFLNYIYSNEHPKREHLWMTFRYLAECDDQHGLITVESLRRRLLMMNWH